MYEEQKEEHKTELVFICPTFIIGEFLINKDCMALKLWSDIMSGKMSSLPQIYMGLVDVNDVATAHVNALTMGKTGQRYIVCSEVKKLLEAAQIIEKLYKDLGYDVTTSEMCMLTIWIGKLINTDAAYFYRMWNVQIEYVTDLSKADLKLKYTPVETTFKNMCESFIEHKIVPNLKEENFKKDEDAKSVHGKDEEVKK